MFKSLLFLCCLLFAGQTMAQQPDSLTAVSFFGTMYAVKQGEALRLGELKRIVKSNPEAFAAFKKARRWQWVAIGTSTLGLVSFFVGIGADGNNPGQYWAGIVGAGALTGTSIAIQQGVYSRYVLETINIHNRKFKPKS